MLTYRIFSMIRIRETGADRLVNEEDISVFVPRVGVEGGFVWA